MVQPDDDLALAFSISRDDQQGGDARFGDGPQERKDDFNADKLSARQEYVMGHQLA